MQTPTRTTVFIPGFMCDGALWQNQVDALRNHTNCVVADMTSGSSIAELAAQILENTPKPFNLVGFSLGGYVAQEVLRKSAGAVERLALIGTSSRGDDDANLGQRMKLALAANVPGTFSGISIGQLRLFVHPSRYQDEALTSAIRLMTKRVGRETFLRQSAITWPDGHDILRAFRGPAAVMCGADDRIRPLDTHIEMAAAMPHARLTVIETCGHMAPLERPEVVTGALLDLLTA